MERAEKRVRKDQSSLNLGKVRLNHCWHLLGVFCADILRQATHSCLRRSWYQPETWLQRRHCWCFHRWLGHIKFGYSFDWNCTCLTYLPRYLGRPESEELDASISADRPRWFTHSNLLLLDFSLVRCLGDRVDRIKKFYSWKHDRRRFSSRNFRLNYLCVQM